MSATFTDDDLEKTVENESGEVIGTVTSVEDDRARVEPRAGLVDSIRAALGWSGSHDDTVAIHEDAVDEISSETIRLETETDGETATDSSPTESTDADVIVSTGNDVDDTGEPASRSDEAAPNAAERDPDGELTEERDRTARRDTVDDTGEPTGNAAERVAESDASSSGEEQDRPGSEEAPSETTGPAEPSMIDDPDVGEPIDAPDEPEMGEPINAPGDPETSESIDAPDDAEGADPMDEFDTATSDGTADAPGDVEPPDDIDPSGASSEMGTASRPDDEPLETDAPTEPDETDADAGAADTDTDGTDPETAASPDEMSGTRAADSPGEMDREGVRNTPVGEAKSAPDHAEMGAPVDDAEIGEPAAADREDETESTSESAASAALDDASESATEERDPAGELDTGADLEDAVEPTDRERSDEPGETGRDSSATDGDADIADAVDTGVDLESAAESTPDDDRGAASSETESMDLADAVGTGVDIESAATDDAASRTDARPETELDPDVDARSGPEADPRPETELESTGSIVDDAATRDDSLTADEQQSPADVVPGVDIESAVDSDEGAGSETEIDPETLAGRGADTEPADGEVARERVDDEPEIDDAEMGAADQSGRSGSPFAAALAAQRAAMTGGQELVKQGIAAQRAAARSAVETPLRMQRQGLEAMQAATSGYFDAVDALLGGGAGSDRGSSESMDEMVTELEDEYAHLPATEFEQQLAVHLELLRSMQTQLEETGGEIAGDANDEIAGDLLERQVAILEACQQRLADD